MKTQPLKKLLDRLHDEKKTSMGLIIHAKFYRDILIRRVEEDIQRIDEILTI